MRWTNSEQVAYLLTGYDCPLYIFTTRNQASQFLDSQFLDAQFLDAHREDLTDRYGTPRGV